MLDFLRVKLREQEVEALPGRVDLAETAGCVCGVYNPVLLFLEQSCPVQTEGQ